MSSVSLTWTEVRDGDIAEHVGARGIVEQSQSSFSFQELLCTPAYLGMSGSGQSHHQLSLSPMVAFPGCLHLWAVDTVSDFDSQ